MRDSDPRLSPCKGDTLAAELIARKNGVFIGSCTQTLTLEVLCAKLLNTMKTSVCEHLLPTYDCCSVYEFPTHTEGSPTRPHTTRWIMTALVLRAGFEPAKKLIGTLQMCCFRPLS
jgi:hypothetical protein